jgi:hypothetical protein
LKEAIKRFTQFLLRRIEHKDNQTIQNSGKLIGACVAQIRKELNTHIKH